LNVDIQCAPLVVDEPRGQEKPQEGPLPDVPSALVQSLQVAVAEARTPVVLDPVTV
jgi:hypothetical protein